MEIVETYSSMKGWEMEMDMGSGMANVNIWSNKVVVDICIHKEAVMEVICIHKVAAVTYNKVVE